MAREGSIVQSLVEMADPLVDKYDVVDLLTGLAGRCVNLLRVAAVGAMLYLREGPTRPKTTPTGRVCWPSAAPSSTWCGFQPIPGNGRSSLRW